MLISYKSPSTISLHGSNFKKNNNYVALTRPRTIAYALKLGFEFGCLDMIMQSYIIRSIIRIQRFQIKAKKGYHLAVAVTIKV
ncbi:MAG: hypothetical protein ATN31_11475 [Candidatus Epulonipiscioides saccharophilum]|nr:MAG: hypothetical protein ATN31_11475 [Epulopiscium sp. AS2M-Bin001]